MRLQDLLSQYPDEGLDQLARDKLDEITNVRLPRTVLEREIAGALSSFSYVAEVLGGSHPPTYAFLKLMMEADGHAVPAAGFKELVLERTDATTQRAATGSDLPDRKEYGPYRALLMAAWQFGGRINESESNLLEAYRSAVGLSMREHLLLEHHPEVRPVWDSPRAYESARNYLLARGIVLATEDQYVLPDEVRLQVRRYWGMELHDADYRRLLDHLTTRQLREVLEAAGLQMSGSKEERRERVIAGLVAPSTALDRVSIVDLKSVARDIGLRVSLSKAELVSQMIAWFDGRREDRGGDTGDNASVSSARRLQDGDLLALLLKLSANQLYEVSASLGIGRSGSKIERAQRLVASQYDEATILAQLRRRDLVRLCRKLGLAVSGLKEELIDRLVLETPHVAEAEDDDEAVLQLPTPETATTERLLDSDRERSHAPREDSREVAGLEEIRRSFPQLHADEQVMLALLREARSLNERDVQRLAARHDLGWTLPKAHMAELLGKLVSEGPIPVRIRSTGAANIYEWVESLDPVDGLLDRWASRDVIDALRQGVVPERHLDMLMVGQDAARHHLLEQIDYIATGRSAFKFIRGAYGSGKSFLAAWLRDQALQRGFAVSSVRISAELSLSDLGEFYSGLIDGLRTPEKRGASSLSDVLESWLLHVQRKVAQIEGLSMVEPDERERLAQLVSARILDEASHLASHDPGMAPALAAFYDARIHGREDRAMAATAWVRGDRSLSSAALRSIGVRGLLEADQALPRLRALLEIIAGTHHRGLVILIDELELVRRRPQKQARDQAYETLRALIDEAGENRLPGCLVVCTGTDTFFDDRRYGLASYEALLHRVSAPPLGDGHWSMRQTVIPLAGLDEDRMRLVAERTRALHGTAYGWDAGRRVSDEDLDHLVAEWSNFGGGSIDRLPRPFLRQLVHVLDLCEENPGLEARELFGEPQDDPEANEALLRLVSD
jgi:hypothetical protein